MILILDGSIARPFPLRLVDFEESESGPTETESDREAMAAAATGLRERARVLGGFLPGFSGKCASESSESITLTDIELAERDDGSDGMAEKGELAREDGTNDMRLLALDASCETEDAARDGARELNGVRSLPRCSSNNDI